MSKIGYVVKRYPRYSETFVVNEILSHERAGLGIDIFALRPSSDTHFQSILSDVRASVHYLDTPSRASDFWSKIASLSERFPGLWEALDAARRIPAREVYQALHLAELVADRDVAHLHAHFATSATDVARLASRIADIPFSFTAHAKDIFHEDVDPVALVDKLRDAAAVVTVSDYNVQFLQDKFGSFAARVRRIYNGLNVNEFSFTPPDDRAPEILAVGRLVEKKGFDVLIDACAVLRRYGKQFRCTIVGDGDQKAALEQRIRDLQLGESVSLLGPRPRKEVIALIRRASVMAVPCVVGSDGNQDGLPTVLLESMALGTPCVSTDVTGIPEILRHRETGLMVPQRDVRALADALSVLLDQPKLRRSLAERARALIETSFDAEVTCAELRDLFARVIDERPGATVRRISLGRVA